MRLLRPVLIAAAVLALPLWATLDRDGDGLSDIWAALYPTAGVPEADPDGDGATNSAEALAGTDPTSASNHLAATPQRDGSGNLVLYWTGVAGKHYSIESSANLSTWTVLPGEYTGAGAALSAIVCPAGNPSGPRQFWRVTAFDVDTDSDRLNDWEEGQLGTSPATADTDHDGMPDGWEVAHELNPLADDSAADLDGDGQSNLGEFRQGSDPSDYYSGDTAGIVPELSIRTIDNPTGTVGLFNPLPVVVYVANQNNALQLRNAPVTVTVQSGGGLLALTNTGTPALSSTLALRTDGNKTVSFYYRQPAIANVTSTISISSGTAQATFTTTSTSASDIDGNGLPDAWEYRYLGQAQRDPNSDPGKVGRTLLQSWQQGLTPWPIPPLTDGLRAWYRADVGVLMDAGNNVNQWTDLSGIGFHLVQTCDQFIANPTRKPMFVANAENNPAAIAFSGYDALSTRGLVDVLNGSQDLTVIAVIRPDAIQEHLSTLVDMSVSYTEACWRLSATGLADNQFALTWAQSAAQSDRAAGPPLQTSAGAVQVLTVVKAGATASSYINGEVIGPAPSSSGLWNTPQRLVLGNQNFPIAGFRGQVVEVLIYNRALGGTERQQLETALAGKLGIPYENSEIDPANGLPVKWEMKYFGHLGVDPTADTNGDGLTNWEDYLSGRNPVDYYNGVAPTIFPLVDSDGELNSEGSLAVMVRDSKGKILVNAPIVFTASDSGHLLSATLGGSGSVSVEVRTNTNGIAKAYVVPAPSLP